ncbi:hypothetical protein WMY93_023729 [Mugilogobius chulae]|uniref:C2 domain-containing protein n=1 Tax=Mugilogobius chulae TaxID=88201 RepID=A0AAW0N848_9GOBI
MLYFDDTAADVPVRDTSLDVPRLTLDTSGAANARVRQDVLRMSREELEDKFLRLNDENLNLKQHINKQDDKIKKLATKLMRLVKDRSRLEQLASGATPQPGPRVRDVGMEEMIEDLQDNIRSLQSENEALKQRLHVAKQQILQQGRRATPYSHVHSRINSGMKKLRDTPSPSPMRPKSARSSEGAGRPPTGQLPRYGHSLLEEARAEIRNLENVIESQRSHMEALEGDAQLLRDELRRKEEEFEERLLDARQQQTSNLRTHVNSNVNMIKLQKQLAERSNAITELEGRFLQLQELQEQISELEQERDLLKENNNKLLSSAFDVSQQQKWQIQEQKLKLQISQLETALQADLVDKNEILDKVKAERETSEKLTEENKKLHIQFLEQKQQLEEMKDQLKVYSKDSDYDVSELTEALLLVKKRKSQRSGELAFLTAVGDEVNLDVELKELRAAHAEVTQELEKTRSLLSVESRICRGYKAELDTVSSKVKCERLELEQRLESQAKLLDSRAARIKKLEAQLKDIAYGTKSYVFKTDVSEEDEADQFNESLHLERGENLLELQICGASLSPSALQALSDPEPSTFCTYRLHLFELHSTPVVSGRSPQYGFTSRYVVRVDGEFLDYVNRSAVTVELHQAQGVSDETRSFGSLDYWFRLRIPMKQTLLLYKEKLKAVDYVSSDQPLQQPPLSDDWNELCVTVHSCSGLRSRSSAPPSPYVVYRFYDSPDYPSETAEDSSEPLFNDSKLYSVAMDFNLHRYLSSEVVQFYVFDYKEEQMDVYLGKAKVPLKPLAQDKAITGLFELSDPAGLPAGHIQLSLKWKLSYLPPPGQRSPQRSQSSPLNTERVRKQRDCSTAKLRQKTLPKEGPAAKKVTFVETSVPETQPVSESLPAAPDDDEDEEEEESHFSEGQLLASSSQSDDSDQISDQITDHMEGVRSSARGGGVSVSAARVQSFPGCLSGAAVRGVFSAGRGDVETPVSLPKPTQGQKVNFNYSKVIPVDAENHSERRRLLRTVLQGKSPQMEMIRFTVVSEPLEEEEQERECEDVGLAFLRLPEILQNQQDLNEAPLNVLDAEDQSAVIGVLTVSVEGLSALSPSWRTHKSTASSLLETLLPVQIQFCCRGYAEGQITAV